MLHGLSNTFWLPVTWALNASWGVKAHGWRQSTIASCVTTWEEAEHQSILCDLRMSFILTGHEVMDQVSRKKRGDLMFIWLWCAKVYSLFLLYIQLYFAPTPPVHPAPTTSDIPMSLVTVTVTIANQSSPAERRQPNKEEQKKGYFQFVFSC